MAKRKASNIFVWIILGLLFVGLAGFGIGGFGGTVTTVASVGDAEITAEEYARALRDQQSRVSQATGQPLTLEQLRALGLDRQVIEALIAVAALEHEAGAMGLSVGDAEVARRILAEPAFQGAGGFDREAYAFTLRRAGLTEARFEEDVRAEAARAILQAAVLGAVDAPEAYVELMAGWAGERRDVTLFPVGVDRLEGDLAPTEAELAAFFEAEAARFERPERRRVTYAALTPEAAAGGVRVSAADIESLYVARADSYSRPARVIAERLVYGDEALAQAAAEALAAGDTTFEALVEARGLTLEEVDLGDVTAADVGPAAAEALFALEGPGVVGPVETALGPALFRVNAVLAASTTPLGEVRDELRATLAAEGARRLVDAEREPVDDLLAGGATLEEVAAETALELGTVEWDGRGGEGLLADGAFAAAVAAAAEGDFPELIELEGGGIAALRIDEVVPPAVPPLAEVRGAVEAAWREARTAERLAEAAGALAARLAAGETAEALGLSPRAIPGLARDATVEDGPPDVAARAFEAEAGEALALPGDAARAFVLRVDRVIPSDPADPATAALRDAFREAARREVAADLFEAYGQAVQEEAGLTVDQGAVQAVQGQLLAR